MEDLRGNKKMTQKQKEHLGLVVYQIYPRSFKDSNNDGIGDIKGITEKLDYIKALGANAIWLSPCYKSPNEDNGYDISDYRDIMDEFGTLDDWKNMIDQMHKRGIKLIMDFVANHTSAEHKWFAESRKSKDNPYRDYYYWADEPLNDWQSTFGGSAWQYDEITDQYYLHSYAVGQPDLNWENPKVRQEMIEVIDYWVKLGVDGFRCDVLDQISKDFENDLNGNGPRLHEYISILFDRPETRHLFLVGECWGANEDNVRLLTGADRNELSTVFQFDHIVVGYKDGYRFTPTDFVLDDVRCTLSKWQNFMQDNDLVATLFFENHDQPRAVSRFGDQAYRFESATMLATMSYLQKGVPFIYQGQEIGSINPYYDKIEAFDDIETKNYYEMNPNNLDKKELMDRINFGSRDNSRRPMPWDASENGGFGNGRTWISVHNKYNEINVEADLKAEKSVYKYFQRLLALRLENEAFITGKYEDITGDRKGIYVYKRYTESDCYIVVCNFETQKNLDIMTNCELVLTNYGKRNIEGIYKPYECAVYKVKKENI